MNRAIRAIIGALLVLLDAAVIVSQHVLEHAAITMTAAIFYALLGVIGGELIDHDLVVRLLADAKTAVAGLFPRGDA